MGITGQGLAFVLSARRHGVDFGRTITIGRQFLLATAEEIRCLADAEDDEGRAALLRLLRFPRLQEDPPTFAEPLFTGLGAREVASIDGSDFEGATFVHDLNTPLPASFDRRYSVVLDGGCLEHVFDFAAALRTCMGLVAVGGHLLCMAPVNNAAGHGFYQLSPEVYFRALSPESGFEVERVLLAEVRPDATWYQVVDPAVAGRRIEFTTRHQAYLYVQARRVDDRPPLAVPPVQSDYAQLWRGPGPAPPTGAGGQRRLEAVRAVVRRHPAVATPLRRLRAAPARYRHWRNPLDPRLFQPLGRRLP